MGFVTSGGTDTTVQVDAKLTDAGKKKLYDSIESGQQGFITKFAIGDSDANYSAIALGASALNPGTVPAVSDFMPSIRSFSLYQGQYRPGTAVLLINDDYGTDNGVVIQVSIGANEPINTTFQLKSEWPKNESFSEDYSVIIRNPGNISWSVLNSLFRVTQSGLGEDVWVFQFLGNASIEELEALIGPGGSGNSTTIPNKIIGRTTNAQTILNIEIIQ